MTKTEQIDAVKMMREIRKQFNEQIKGMSFEEEKAFIESRIKHVIDKYRAIIVEKPDAA